MTEAGANAGVPRYDLHAHSTYSDGSAMEAMVTAARSAGLEGLGFADHCVVVEDRFRRRDRYDLVETYDARRADIEALRQSVDIAIFDAAEVSYVEEAEDATAGFLERADFDYTIGSVHFAGPYRYTGASQYADADESARRTAVDRYYDAQVALIESELFEVAGHIDLVQRIPNLRGLTTEEHYRRLASAFEGSRTVPEINAGRLTRGYGEIHPEPPLLEYLRDRDVAFTLGTDAHRPDEVRNRIDDLSTRGLTADVYPV